MMDSFFWRKFLARTGFARLVPTIRRELRGGENYLRYYSDRTLALPVNELRDPALMPEPGTPDTLNLAQAVPACDLPSGLGRALYDRRPIPAWGDLELRGELATRFHQDHGSELDPAEEMLITHGASGGYASVLEAFVNPGDRVVLFDPTSPLFPIGLKHRRARISWVPTWSDAGRARFALDALAAAMRGAKLLVLADPVNPTGGVFAPEDLEQIAFWARKHDVLVFQDVSFDRWRQAPPRARLASLPHLAGRLLTCNSFGRSHGLTGARVGWLAGHRHLVWPCAAAGLMAAPFVPSLCQQAALHALQSGEVQMTALRDELADRGTYVRGRLHGMGLEPCESAAGYFTWVPVPTPEPARDFARRLLRETGVLVNPGEPFGPSGGRFIRISHATDEGRLREGLNRLERFLQGARTSTMPVE